jgi:uncharacterized membrane protein
VSQESENHGWPDHAEARRDLHLGRLLFAVLFGLCALGVILLLTAPRAKSLEGSLNTISGICLLFAVMAVLTMIWLLPKVARRLANALSALGSVTRWILVAVVVLATMVGIVIVFFATCSAVLMLGDI